MKKPTKVKAAKRAPQWEIRREPDIFSIGKMKYHYWTRLRGANGEIVATTELYTRKANALKAIKLIQASAGAKVVDLTKGAK